MRTPRRARPPLGFTLDPGLRVGLFGGSFNPAHEGHAHVAETALRRLRLDRVLWLVSPQNPLKASRETASLAARLAGARRLARGRRMIVADAESRLGTQFTLDTVRALRRRFPGVRFVWIMGADNLASFHRWAGWQTIMRALPVAVISRTGYSRRSLDSPTAVRFRAARLPAAAASTLAGRRPPAWVYLAAHRRAQSSSALRRQAERGELLNRHTGETLR